MKKLIIIILALSLWSCQEKTVPIKSRYTPVNVGTTANDGTGDNLRAAFIKVNAGFAEIADSLGNIYTEAQTRAVISDTIVQRIEDAIEITDIMPSWADTTGTFGGVVSWNQLVDYVSAYGGGEVTGSGWEISQFTIGVTTGAPENADSSYTQSAFIGKNIGLYRDGLRQTLNFTATNTQEGFRFNNVTGAMTVNPPFSTGEQIIIAIDEPISYTYIPIEGEESDLLDSLLVYYNFDETIGTTVNDALGVNDATSNAVVNQAGILGKSRLFDGNDYASVANHASLIPDDDEISVSLWFRLTSLPSTEGHIAALVRARHAGSPSYAFMVYIQTDDAVTFHVSNSSTVFEYETVASAVVTDTWYHLVCVNEGNGEEAKIYLNGSDVTDSGTTAFSGDILQFNSTLYIGNINSTDNYGIVGYIDELGIFDEALTSDQVSELYKSGVGLTYPF